MIWPQQNLPRRGLHLFSRVVLCEIGFLICLGLAGCSSSGSSSPSSTAPVTPTIQWATPAPVVVGATLSAAQLDATATAPGANTALPGAFVYTPSLGTVLSTAGTQTLSVTFFPTNTLAYASTTGTVSLAVTAAPLVTPTIQWATPAAVPIGTILSATQLDATAVVPGTTTAVAGTFSYTPALGTSLNTAGTQILSVSFTPTNTAVYASATGTVSLTVNAAAALVTPTIQWATPAPVNVGATLSATQLDATAVVPGTSTAVAGTFTYTPPAGTVLSTAGAQTLSAAFAPTDTTTYTSATSTVTLTVNAAGVPSYTWQNVQIVGGGYVDGVIMHPGQQGLMYARTDVGGAYRYNSTTSSWVPLTDFTTRANSNQIGIESVAIDPSDVNRLYLAVGEYFGQNGAMLVSDDQGATFTNVPLSIQLSSNANGRNAGERLAVDPNLGSNIYFGSPLNGLWQSTNYGQTWSQVTGLNVSTTSGVGVVFETFVPSTSSAGTATKTIYAGVSATGTGTDPQSLYVSVNSGTTWTAVPGSPTGLYVTHGVLGPDGNLYLTYGDNIGPNGLTTGQVWQYVLPTTTNPNGTWNNITPPRTSSTQGGYGAVALDPEKPGVIMVSTLDNYGQDGNDGIYADDIWRSLNYGQTWYSTNEVGTVRNDSLSPWVAFGRPINTTGASNWATSMQIDPFDSNHVVYGNGQTVWTTDDITVSDSGSPSQWSVGALGIEETVVLGLISPPSGPANLLSGVGDLGGFQHVSLTASPVAGAMSNPLFGNGTGLDFAQSTPTIMARVGTGASNSQFGAYSTNSGTSWTPFATNPTSTVNGGGSIAVAADGSAFVWAPSDPGVATSYSTNNGATWTASTGAPAQMPVVADRVSAKIFYIFDTSNGDLYTSTDGGMTFTVAQTGLPQNGVLTAAYDVAGDLWLATSSGLYHATQGNSLTQVGGVQSAWGITAGVPAVGSNTLTLYLGGQIAGQQGLYRSTDNAATWIRIDDAANEYGYINTIQADEQVYGRIYLGTSGRGIVYGDSPN